VNSEDGASAAGDHQLLKRRPLAPLTDLILLLAIATGIATGLVRTGPN